jgi:hypothetical protein
LCVLPQKFGGFNRIPMSHVRSASAAADAASDWQKVRAEWFARFKEEYERKVAEHPDVDWSDELAVDARHYRESWERIYARAYGPFDKSSQSLTHYSILISIASISMSRI